MFNKSWLFSLLFVFGTTFLFGQDQKPEKWKDKKYFTIVNYNVENLFDTVDAPQKKDEEFTPQGKKQWNSERYYEKLEKLASVIQKVNNEEFPEIIGFQEVENINTLRDLAKTKSLNGAGYEAIVIEGPDFRGIDCGLLYRPDAFEVIDKKAIEVKFSDPDAWPTRDILYVKGETKKNVVHVFVNHWSSRRGGQEKSEHKRVLAAKILKKYTDSIMSNFPDQRVVIMGDFNDEPTNKSLSQTLNAGRPGDDSKLINLMYPLDDKGKGTYYYRGSYNMLDNIVVSSNVVQANKGFRVFVPTGFIFNPDFICYTHKNGDKGPNRTYGGNNYYGGYSDHFPVYAIFYEK